MMARRTTLRAGVAAMSFLFASVAAAQVQNTTTTLEYDSRGNLTKVSDALNHATSYGYDALSRRVSETDAATGVTHYSYDGLDQLTQVADPRNVVTSYLVDGLGNLKQLTSADTGLATSTYDDAGNLLSRTDAKQQTTTYQYDVLDRLVLKTFSDGSTVAYQYDVGAHAMGRLNRITDSSGSIEYAYNLQGRITSETRVIGGSSYTTSYRYDTAGRLSGMSYPGGRSIDYTLDAMGRTSQIAASIGGVATPIITAVSYQPFGPVQSQTFGNGNAQVRTFDLDGRMSSYTLAARSMSISYDAANRITSIADAAHAASGNTYSYDVLDRLTQALTPSVSHGYSYDAVGNRTQKATNGNLSNNLFAASSNRLTQSGSQTITTDANGSITNKGSATFSYDARGRMVSANTAIGLVQYTINSLGQRVRKVTPTETTTYHYDLAGKLIAESTTGATVSGQDYVYLGSTPVAIIGAEAHFIFSDQVSTAREIVNAAGAVVWESDAEPFGANPPDENPNGLGVFTYNQRFPGQYFDRETGLHYNYYRDYDPQTGRYVQSDPIGLEGGINTYAYGGSNPLLYIDSQGLQAVVPTPIGPIPLPVPVVTPGTKPLPPIKIPTWTFPDKVWDRIDPLKTSDAQTSAKSCIEVCYSILERPKKGWWDDSNTMDFHKCLADCNAAKNACEKK